MADQAPTQSAVRFGPFELFVETGELRKDGVRLKLSGQPIQLLARLVAAPGKLVTREDLQQELWHGSSYGDFEKGLNAAVNRLREYLGDSATEPKYIETIPRRGYRFIADINSGLSKTPSVEFQQPKPRWKRTTRLVAGVLLAIALVAGLVVAGYFGRHPLKAVPTQGRGRVMLAVLPFENLSGDPEQEYFSDGLTEETITDLGELNPAKLGVIARASAMAYKHTNKTAGQIGQELAWTTSWKAASAGKVGAPVLVRN